MAVTQKVLVVQLRDSLETGHAPPPPFHQALPTAVTGPHSSPHHEESLMLGSEVTQQTYCLKWPLSRKQNIAEAAAV